LIHLLYMLQNDLQIQALQTRTGSVLASTTESAAAAHASPMIGVRNAIQKAAANAFNGGLADALIGSFQDFINNGLEIQLQIQGVNRHELARRVTDLVSGLGKTISNRQDAWQGDSGLLLLSLRFRGSEKELAASLDGKSIEHCVLEVKAVQPARVMCSLNSR